MTLWPGLHLHEHQVAGIQRMVDMERKGTLLPPFTQGEETFEESLLTGGFLCDGMGVGKTIETLCLLAENPQKSTLLLMPKALIGPWVENGHRADFPCFVVEDGKWVLTKKGSRKSALYITNYETVLHRPDLTTHLVWDRVVLDESHRIRTPGSRLSRLVVGLRADFRWALSGTPLVNSQRDIATQLAFLGVPHTESFRWVSDYYDPLLPSLVIRRSMEDIRGLVSTVPPVPEVEIHALDFLSSEEADFYHGLQGLRDILKYGRISRKQILELLLRLRQTAVSPEIYMSALRRQDPTYEECWAKPSTKMAALAHLVKDGQEEHKFLVFCSFHEEMELIAGYLKRVCGTQAELYHGRLSNAERADVLERAQQPSCRVFLIQLQSGGVGLNLQSFDRVVFMCPWWTAALMDQAIARAVRMGQTQTVKIIHLVLSKVEELGLDIDKFIMGKAEAKRELLEEFFELATRSVEGKAKGTTEIKPEIKTEIKPEIKTEKTIKTVAVDEDPTAPT
jgi:SNF2 family DNA or RNA helicase